MSLLSKIRGWFTERPSDHEVEALRERVREENDVIRASYGAGGTVQLGGSGARNPPPTPEWTEPDGH